MHTGGAAIRGSGSVSLPCFMCRAPSLLRTTKNVRRMQQIEKLAKAQIDLKVREDPGQSGTCRKRAGCVGQVEPSSRSSSSGIGMASSIAVDDDGGLEEANRDAIANFQSNDQWWMTAYPHSLPAHATLGAGVKDGRSIVGRGKHSARRHRSATFRRSTITWSTVTEAKWPLLRIGTDRKSGWDVLDFAPRREPAQIIRVDHGVRSLEVVLQQDKLRVYVHPERGHFDLFQSPIGTEGTFVGSPCETAAEGAAAAVQDSIKLLR